MILQCDNNPELQSTGSVQRKRGKLDWKQIILWMSVTSGGACGWTCVGSLQDSELVRSQHGGVVIITRCFYKSVLLSASTDDPFSVHTHMCSPPKSLQYVGSGDNAVCWLNAELDSCTRRSSLPQHSVSLHHKVDLRPLWLSEAKRSSDYYN